jgi:hypothetical protein
MFGKQLPVTDEFNIASSILTFQAIERGKRESVIRAQRISISENDGLTHA